MVGCGQLKARKRFVLKYQVVREGESELLCVKTDVVENNRCIAE